MIVVLFILSITPVFAHNNTQREILGEEVIEEYGNISYVGGEIEGWSIDESLHLGSTSGGYRFDLYFPDNLKLVVDAGAQMWAEIVTFTHTESGIGYFSTFNNPRDGVVAVFSGNADPSDSSGHLISWNIRVNIAYSITDEVIAHELGYVIGLNDLYDASNANKLMFNNADDCTANAPTESDKWGAKVITGIHEYHNWGEYGVIKENYYHARYCTQCNGASASVQACSFATVGSISRCTICGRRMAILN